MTPIIKKIAFLLFLLALTVGSATAQSITSISPASVPAGSGKFALTVSGTNFSSDAIVEINNQPLLTIPHGSTTLTALVYASDSAKPGKLAITVLNDSGTTPHLSNEMILTVTGSGTPPPPPGPTPTPRPGPTPTPSPMPGKVSIYITSPTQNQQVCAPVSVIASAVTTNRGAQVTRWIVADQTGKSLWTTNGPTSSISPRLTLSPGTRTLQIEAWDSTGAKAYSNVAFDVSTATPPCGGNGTGKVTSWKGCLRNVSGSDRQAVVFQLSEAATLPFDATLYFGANCKPSNWADRFGFGQNISFGGFGYTFWFRDFPNQPDTSAIWTVGNQSSGCINYNAVPKC